MTILLMILGCLSKDIDYVKEMGTNMVACLGKILGALTLNRYGYRFTFHIKGLLYLVVFTQL